MNDLYIVRRRPPFEIGAEPSLVAGAGAIDIQLLVLKDINRQCALVRRREQSKQDEQPAHMHADLSDGSFEPVSGLNASNLGNESRAIGVQPSGDFGVAAKIAFQP